MKKLSKKALCLAAAGLVLVGGASVGSAYAYFTTYTEASGGVVFEMGATKTEIHEDVKDGMKIVSIENTAVPENGPTAATITGGTTATWFSRARLREP